MVIGDTAPSLIHSYDTHAAFAASR